MTIKFGPFKININSTVSEETKARVVANIEKANSKAYKHQVASHAIVGQVIDDMVNDPFWREVITEAIEYRKSQGLQ